MGTVHRASDLLPAGAPQGERPEHIMTESIDPRSRGELRALLHAIEEGGWDYARIEIDGAVLTVAADADFAALDPAVRATTPPTGSAAVIAGPEPVHNNAIAPGNDDAIAATDERLTPPASGSGPVPANLHTVTAPTIGLFWRSPKPSAPPFVQVGDRVESGDTVCIIEVMKLMTNVSAGVTGIVRTIHVSNGEMVEHGTPLVDVEPEVTS